VLIIEKTGAKVRRNLEKREGVMRGGEGGARREERVKGMSNEGRVNRDKGRGNE